jgi:hypothetical protein
VTGSFKVSQAVFSGQPLERFDATFVQQCEGASPALYGEITYDSAPVATPPARVSSLKTTGGARGVRLTWKNPAHTGCRYTVVRVEPANPGGVGPSAGVAAYSGTRQNTTVTGLLAGHKYTIVVYTVDRCGKVSHPAEQTVTG